MSAWGATARVTHGKGDAVNLNPYEGKLVRVAGSLLPEDRFILSPGTSRILGEFHKAQPKQPMNVRRLWLVVTESLIPDGLPRRNLVPSAQRQGGSGNLGEAAPGLRFEEHPLDGPSGSAAVHAELGSIGFTSKAGSQPGESHRLFHQGGSN